MDFLAPQSLRARTAQMTPVAGKSSRKVLILFHDNPYPPPVCFCLVVFLTGNRHRPGKSHFLRPPNWFWRAHSMVRFPPPPPPNRTIRFAPPLAAFQNFGFGKRVFWKRGLFRNVHFLEILENLEILEILENSPNSGK